MSILTSSTPDLKPTLYLPDPMHNNIVMNCPFCQAKLLYSRYKFFRNQVQACECFCDDSNTRYFYIEIIDKLPDHNYLCIGIHDLKLISNTPFQNISQSLNTNISKITSIYKRKHSGLYSKILQIENHISSIVNIYQPVNVTQLYDKLQTYLVFT